MKGFIVTMMATALGGLLADVMKWLFRNLIG
jgi:hypothetical protein